MSDKHDHHEREAEASSNEVMAGPVPVQSAPGNEDSESGPLDAVQRSASQKGSAESGSVDVVQRARTKEESSKSSKSSGKRKADREKGRVRRASAGRLAAASVLRQIWTGRSCHSLLNTPAMKSRISTSTRA